MQETLSNDNDNCTTSYLDQDNNKQFNCNQGKTNRIASRVPQLASGLHAQINTCLQVYLLGKYVNGCLGESVAL